MDCRQHPGVGASGTCAGCAEAFCNNCLVTVAGTRYCASCKSMALPGTAAAAVALPTVECKEAKEAFTLAVVSLFCMGVFIAPMAISKALAAQKLCDKNPSLSGRGKANAAIAIGVVAFFLWILGMVSKVGGVSAK